MNEKELTEKLRRKATGAPIGNNVAQILKAYKDFLEAEEDEEIVETLFNLAQFCGKVKHNLERWAKHYSKQLDLSPDDPLYQKLYSHWH